MTSLKCRIAAPWIVALGSGEEVPFAPMNDHIERCLYCQASIARQRRLRRSLEDLALLPESAPAPGVPHPAAEGSMPRRPLILGAVGAAIAVGIGVIGLRRTLAH